MVDSATRKDKKIRNKIQTTDFLQLTLSKYYRDSFIFCVM